MSPDRVEDTLQRVLPEGIEGAVAEVPDSLEGSRLVAASFTEERRGWPPPTNI